MSSRHTAAGVSIFTGGLAPVIRVGLDQVLDADPKRFGRVGWLLNGSAVTTGSLIWGPRAAIRQGFEVVRLFGPEHGPHGAVREGERVGDTLDDATGVPVCSMYSEGAVSLEEALGGCDTVFVDLVDLGARYSTYLDTATELLEAAARVGRRVVVLDRPNLLGRRREGPGLSEGTRSAVGKLPIPIRHGLTMGEILGWYRRSKSLDVEFEVIAVQGWDGRTSDPGAVPYLAPSPNLNTFGAQLLYVGTCLVEGTNLSEGRGTANPFQVVGAPWLQAEAIVDQLQAEQWPGVAYRAVRFVPWRSKHNGLCCAGVFLHVLDRDALTPLQVGVRLLELVFATHPEAEVRPAQRGQRFLDLLWGSAQLADHLQGGGARAASFEVGSLEGFSVEIEPDLLYGPER